MEFPSHHPALVSLRKHWSDAHSGKVVQCAVTSPYGVTAQKIVTQFQNEIATEVLTWAVRLEAHDSGMAIIPKVVAGLHRAIYRSTRMQSTLINKIRSVISDSKDPLEVDRLSIFRDALHILKLSEGKTMVFPDNTPLTALLRCVQFVVETFPTLMLIEKADACHSMAIPTLLQLLADQSDDDQQLMVVLSFSTVTDVGRYHQPVGLLSLITDLELPVYDVGVLNNEEVGALLKSRGCSLTPEVANWWTGGSQALLADLIDWDNDETHDALMRKSLPALPENGEFILSVAALIGWRFQLGALARLCGTTEMAVKVTLDANPVWVEQNHARPDAPIAYAFTRYLPWIQLRRYVLETQPDFGLAVAQNLETFFVHDRGLLASACFIRAHLPNPAQSEIPRNKIWGFEDNDLWFELVNLASEQKLLWPEEAWDVAFLAAFRSSLDSDPDSIQNIFSRARECFQKLERPHAEIQLFCDAAAFSATAGDIELTSEHFDSAIKIAQGISDTNSNINIRLKWIETLLSVDEIRLAMIQLTLLENLEQSDAQMTHRVWLTAQLAEKQNEIPMALDLYNRARFMGVEQRNRRISVASGLSMIPLLINIEQKSDAKKLHDVLKAEVFGDPTLEKQWDAAKSYFM